MTADGAVAVGISAEALGRWIRSELAGRADEVHAARVVVTEFNRWRRVDDASLSDLFRQAVDTGTERWDALIEGLVARVHHLRHRNPPAWANRTRLDEAWAPYGEVVRSNAWYALDVMTTPAELLHRGVVLPARDLEVL
ncbi:hypothetical protein GCM10028820_13920 [Tessaracoccus terricola]